MCWNKNVSLNTFIFTTFVLIFIYYNNNYTQYKIADFKNNFLYLFAASFTLMQLAEYFIWSSIETKNKEMNIVFSGLAWFLIRVMQPLSVLFLLPNSYSWLRSILLPVYIAVLLATTLYKTIYNPIIFKTIVNKNNHLEWLWNELKGVEIVNIVFYWICMSTLLLSFPVAYLVALLAMIYSIYMFKKTWGSNWCFYVNAILLYHLINILIVMPLYE
jgi:hypothetical protein